MTAKFVIGIDLGTTNSVLAYASLDAEQPDVKCLPIPQLVAPGTIESRSTLPSFLYLATEAETAAKQFDLQWHQAAEYVVGELARAQGAELPQRTVAAAKSWLCHSKVDRHQPILPWGAPKGIPKISPVAAARRYLEHLVAVWRQSFPDAPIAEQLVVLTVPASFDASARELTREAALQAGLPEKFVLLEEPQAALYSWLDHQGDRWRKLLKVGDTLLVVDVGGGTTDLTLIGVEEEGGELLLKRLGVGNHLLVGGDNMDLALAFHVAELFKQQGVNLDPWQSVSLWHKCRAAKEALLSAEGNEKYPISVLGRGSKLIGGTVTIEVDRKQVAGMLADGFFPLCEVSDKPARQRASGFQEIGLPFESDTGITKHVAAFLAAHGADGNAVQPTHLLFNGGVFKANSLIDRLLKVLGDWFGKKQTPQVLDGLHDLDHAVARGAAHYGWSKQHGGMRIRGGTASSYYVGIESAGLAIPGAPRPLRALCVVPFGMEEGTETDVPSDEIGLIVGEPAQFRFFKSSIRKEDQPGDLIPSWSGEEIEETDSMEATLPNDDDIADSYVPVTFHSHITELGLLELWCVNQQTEKRWKLEFSVREDAE